MYLKYWHTVGIQVLVSFIIHLSIKHALCVCVCVRARMRSVMSNYDSIEPTPPVSAVLAGRFFTTEPPRKAKHALCYGDMWKGPSE